MMKKAVDVCVCTFRRQSLQQTLASIAAQQLSSEIVLRVIVADNDHHDGRRSAILADGTALGLTLHYVHAPSQNISVARNACLDAASAPLIAFIDDDEEAAPDWIEALLAHMPTADIVFGVSQARYHEGQTPRWICEGDFHSNRLSGNDPLWNGYTANVMVDRSFLLRHQLRFAIELGQIGGEDTMFFYRAHEGGATFAFAPEAIVYEDTPTQRANLRWLVRRRFRSGQVHFMLVRRLGVNRIRALALALIKAGFCFGAAIVQIGNPVKRASLTLRGALHVGVAASALGFSAYKEYGDRHGTTA